MAKLVNYVAQTGVNRGTGARNTVAIKEQTASKFNQMADMFANDALKQLKKDGEKFGKETALKTKFIDKEVILDGESEPITIPVLAKTPDYLGKTAKENFESVMFKRYATDIQNQIDNIIGTEYQKAVEKDMSPVAIESLLNEKRRVYMENLSPKFGELMDSHWESTFQKKGLAYLGIHNKVRVQEYKNISDNELLNENVKYFNSLSTGETYSNEEYSSIMDGRAENTVITDEEASLAIKEEIKQRNFATNLVSKYRDYIGLQDSEIDGTAKLGSVILNTNRTKLIELLSPEGIRPESVVLRGPKGNVTVTRESIDSLAQGDVTSFGKAKKFLNHNLKVSTGVNSKVTKTNNFIKQIGENADNTINRRGNNFSHFSRSDFQKYADTDEGKRILIDAYNSREDRNIDDKSILTVEDMYKDKDYLLSFSITHQTLPESVIDFYKSALESYDTNALTEQDWEIMTAPRNAGIDAVFSFKNNLGFNAKQTKIADLINSSLNSGQSMEQSIRTAASLSEVDLTTDEGKTLAAQLIGQDYFTKNDFSDAVDQELVNQFKQSFKVFGADVPGISETTSVGAIFASVYKEKLLDVLTRTGKQITNEKDIRDAIGQIKTDDGFHLKYGRSKVSKGFQPKFKDIDDYDDAVMVALPPENFYGKKNVEVIINDQIQEMDSQMHIVNLNIQNMLRKSSNIATRGKDNTLIEFGGLYDLIPTNYNYLHNPNLRENIQSGQIDKPSYFLRKFDKEKNIFVFAEDENGNAIVLEPKHFEEVDPE